MQGLCKIFGLWPKSKFCKSWLFRLFQKTLLLLTFSDYNMGGGGLSASELWGACRLQCCHLITGLSSLSVILGEEQHALQEGGKWSPTDHDDGQWRLTEGDVANQVCPSLPANQSMPARRPKCRVTAAPRAWKTRPRWGYFLNGFSRKQLFRPGRRPYISVQKTQTRG